MADTKKIDETEKVVAVVATEVIDNTPKFASLADADKAFGDVVTYESRADKVLNEVTYATKMTDIHEGTSSFEDASYDTVNVTLADAAVRRSIDGAVGMFNSMHIAPSGMKGIARDLGLPRHIVPYTVGDLYSAWTPGMQVDVAVTNKQVQRYTGEIEYRGNLRFYGTNAKQLALRVKQAHADRLAMTAELLGTGISVPGMSAVQM